LAKPTGIVNDVSKIKIFRLENNLQVQFVTVPGGKTTLFSVGFYAGAMYEKGFGKGSNDGVSHFTEHMFFKGTPSRDANQVNQEFSQLGADLNAFTSYDHTIYYAKVPTRNLRKAAEIWNDLLLNNELKHKEFEAEKQIILQEIQIYKDMPEFSANSNVRAYHFAGTPLEHNILGSMDSITAMSLDTLKEYIEKHYSLYNAIITIVGGGFDLEAEIDFIDRLFNENEKNSLLKPIYPPQVNLPRRETNLNFFKKEINKPLSYLAICWTSPGIKSKLFFPCLLLNTYLGNSRTSIIYRNIISKGISSFCRYGFEPFYDVSASSILFISPPEKLNEVYYEILKILIDLYSLEFTDMIIADLKQEILGAYLSEIEDPANYGIDLAQKFIKFHRPLLPSDYEKSLDISLEIVQKTKDKIFGDKMSLTVYGTGKLPSEWIPDFPQNSPW